MAEIDNSLAAKIQVPQIDIMNPLMKAAQYRNLQAETGLKEQELGHRQFLYNQGGGYDPAELHTRATTGIVQSDLQGRVGSMLVNDQSPASRQNAINTARMGGKSIHPDMERAIMTAPAGDVKKIGENMQSGGQPAGQNIEQNPGQIYKRAQAGTAGGLQGQLTPPPGSGPPSPAGGPTGGAKPTPLVTQVEDARKRGEAGVAMRNKYDAEGTAAAMQSAALHQMLVDASQVRLGAGAAQEEGARKVLIAIGDTVPSLKPYIESTSNKSAAFQSFDKNAGIVSRAITQEVGTTAASGLDMVTKALISNPNTNKGVDVIGHQLIGMSHFKQARSIANNKWSDEHGGDMTNFESNFNKTAGVGAWMFKSLPDDQQKIVGEYLSRPENKSQRDVLVRQLDNIRKEKLDEGIF